MTQARLNLEPGEAVEQLDRLLEIDAEIENETRKLEKATAVRKLLVEVVKELQATRSKLSHEIRHPEDRPLLDRGGIRDDDEDEDRPEDETEEEERLLYGDRRGEGTPPDEGGEYDLNVPLDPETLPVMPTGNGEAKPKKGRKPRKPKFVPPHPDDLDMGPDR